MSFTASVSIIYIINIYDILWFIQTIHRRQILKHCKKKNSQTYLITYIKCLFVGQWAVGTGGLSPPPPSSQLIVAPGLQPLKQMLGLAPYPDMAVIVFWSSYEMLWSEEGCKKGKVEGVRDRRRKW